MLRPPIGTICYTEEPWQRIYVDLLGPYPRSKTEKTFILIILDRFSKFVILRLLSNSSTANVIDLTSVRSHFKDDHRMWDEKLSQIVSALRTSIHNSTQYCPHFLIFGFHKLNHGSSYEILRTLDCLNTLEVELFLISDRLPQIQKDVEHMQGSCKNIEKDIIWDLLIDCL